MKKIMFVCTGNTCRSPMAEAILKAMLKERGITGVKVSSSGVSPVVGQPIMPNANLALKELGFKPVKYRAKQLTQQDLETQDLIICMTEGHRRHVGGGANITTVAAITGLHDVGDPYGDSAATYVKTAEYLKYVCGDIINIIEKAVCAEEKEKAEKAALRKQRAVEKAARLYKAEKPEKPKPEKTVKAAKQGRAAAAKATKPPKKKQE